MLLNYEIIIYRSIQRKRFPPNNADADYAVAPAQAETLLERAAARIGLHVNAHKTEYMCFNQTGDISTLNGSSHTKEAVSHQPR